MSNKETLKTNNTIISTNNTELSSILNTINNLPSSGGENTDIEDAMVTGALTGDYVNNRVTSIGSERLRATQITGLHCEEVTSVGGEAIRDCSNLTYVYLPKCTTITAYGLGLCPKLERAEFNNLKTINALSFYNDTALTKLIIRTTSVCSLANVSGLQGSGIANGTGYIYVPDDLVDSYKSATNWSTYASQIKGLSELV